MGLTNDIFTIDATNILFCYYSISKRLKDVFEKVNVTDIERLVEFDVESA
jgi:hypothetical protein